LLSTRDTKRGICSVKRAILLFILIGFSSAQELHFVLRSEPKTFDPALVEDEASETIRFLTGGVLMRVNRSTQALEPELAVSWKVMEDGRAIELRLREGVTFSNGAPFSAEDVAYTFRRLMDPALHSDTGDAFRSGEGTVETLLESPLKLRIRFSAPIAGLDRLFDQVAILSAHAPQTAVLGPFRIKEYKAGSYAALERNPNYWKRDAAGRRLPYLDGIQLDIQQNREVELLRFQRGELQLINTLEPEHFERLAAQSPKSVHDAGPGMDAEFFWFNQSAASPISSYKREWFRLAAFRRAISEAINRDDISRIVYHGHATPAIGPVSQANKLWFNAALKPTGYRPDDSLTTLQREGFKLAGGILRDPAGRRVEFTIVTNSGNAARERTAAMMQQDLTKIGVKLNIATLDFASLLERMNKTLDYEACLLGLVNVDIDPNLQMNVWMSSSSMHAWSPKEPKPETAWEEEVDRLMRVQASQLDVRKRKAAFDRVQQIVVDQAPIIYLVNKNALSAVSPTVKNANPVALRPQTFWNIERLAMDGPALQSQR
jgi:peptide/nickel transport system substrate-binding protein